MYKMLDFKSDRPDTVEKFAGMRKFVDKLLREIKQDIVCL